MTWAGDLAGSTNTTQTVVGLHFGATATPLSTTAPTSGQVLEWNGTNIVGATNSPTGAIVQAPALASTNTITPTADIVPLTVNAYATSPISDVFDVFANLSGTLTKCFWVAANGNLGFCGNSATYGAANQGAASFVRLYGGTPGPPYFSVFSQSLNPPAAPTLAAVTGTAPVAGVYGVEITYVNAAGETLASASSPITTSGTTTIAIQVTSPSAYYNATGWNAYFTTAGETTTYYKQNTAAIAIGTAYTQSAAIVTTGAAPPSANTTGAASQTNLYASISNPSVVGVSTAVPTGDAGPGITGSTWLPSLPGSQNPTAGHCAEWLSNSQLEDAGAACGSGGAAWSGMTNSAANLILSMAAFTTTFNWTDTALGEWAWDASGNTTLANTEAAALGANVNSPSFSICGQVWGGAGPGNIQDCWKLAVTYGTATNPTSVLNFTHSGSTAGSNQIIFPNSTTLTDTGGTFTLQQLNTNILATAGGGPLVVDNPIQIESAGTAQYSSINLKATAALTAGELVCVDSANAASVIDCHTTTTDQFIGFAPVAIGAGVNGPVALSGTVLNAVVGTGTCAIGNWVVADTTTAGDVKCSTTAPASGDQVGWAMTSQASLGGALTVLIDKR